MKYIFTLLFLCHLSICTAEDRPNILMLCIDDLNDWVGFLDGHPQTKTPHMDALALKGVNFTNAHCTAPGCSPSRNALLFGVEPHKSGLYPFYDLCEVESQVLNDYIPLPLLLRENGYYTVGIAKVWHNPDNDYRQDEQWDEYEYYKDKEKTLLLEKGYHPQPYNKRIVGAPASNALEDFGDYNSAVYAIDFLKKEHENPFFLAVGFIKPHSPFIMPEANFDRFQEAIQEPPFQADDLNDIPLAGQSNAQIYVDIQVRRDNAWEDIRRAYLATINFTDDNVGRVMDALEKSAYADNTIVILWSDHGYHLGEKRSFSKFSLWNESTRTPFIIFDPRMEQRDGVECHEPVGLINVYRTICEMAGIDVPKYVDGLSLLPLLENPQLKLEKPAMTTWGRGNYTLRFNKWRYTRYFDGTEELYDETRDPNEWTNLASIPEYSEVIKKCARWLPQTEAAQVSTGRRLYNVADADQPDRIIRSYLRYVKQYKDSGLNPPLD